MSDSFRSRVIVARDEEFARAAAAEIGRQASLAAARRGSASLALCGGSTPRTVHEVLAHDSLLGRIAIPWDRLSIWWGDERCVPPDHPESNYRMAQESLLHRVPVPPGRIHRIPAERPDRDAAAAEYGALLPEELDLLLLGMGEDGHTASLFPGSPALGESARRVVAVEGPKLPPGRITITPAVIAAARAILVLVTGASKAAMVAQALAGPLDPLRLPAQLARRGIWILDWEAAGELDLR